MTDHFPRGAGGAILRPAAFRAGVLWRGHGLYLGWARDGADNQRELRSPMYVACRGNQGHSYVKSAVDSAPTPDRATDSVRTQRAPSGGTWILQGW